mmetsp:Transcript_26126/g.38683  ORF Transcript_26126/g.38683 Transcript_26126/m.38683 type:complete len:86 (-) Transcript_26126:372-629(-)
MSMAGNFRRGISDAPTYIKRQTSNNTTNEGPRNLSKIWKNAWEKNSTHEANSYANHDVCFPKSIIAFKCHHFPLYHCLSRWVNLL